MTSRFTLRDFSLLCVLFAIGVFFHFAIDGSAFLEPRNLMQLAVEAAIPATLAVGMLLIILPGHIDLSAGSGVGLMGGLATVLVGGTGWLTDALRGFHEFVATHFGVAAAAWIPVPPWPDPLAMVACVLISMLIWGVMGTLIVRERIQAFIVTLGGMLVFRGLFWRVIESKTVPVTGASRGQFWQFDFAGIHLDIPQDWLYRLTTSYLPASVGLYLTGTICLLMLGSAMLGWRRRVRLGMSGDDGEVAFVKWLIVSQLLFIFVIVANQYNGVPVPVVVFGAVALFIHTLTQRTRFGRYLYAIGGNEEAAVISGINVKRVTIWAFVLMGVIVAITGFMQTAFAGYSTSDLGDLMELDAIAACVIGGVSLKGGRGNVLGVFIGALIMATLAKGMSLMGVGPELKYVVRGSVLVFAVWLDTRLSR